MTHLQLQALQPDLTTLQYALSALDDDDDVSSIMPFVIHLDKFPQMERNTALAVLRTTFWTEKANNNYEFKPIFKLLTANNLSIIIKTIGDENIERFIFIEQNEQYLSHYPITDLITLLSSHYSDGFANFVFNHFKGFLKANLSLRIRYFKNISVKAIIEILKNGGVGKSLTNDELIVVTIKMKKYLTSNRHNIDITDNTWLDSQSILPEILSLIHNNIKSLTVKNIQCVVENDLIVDMDQAKNIINELLSRQTKAINTCMDQQVDRNRLIGILSTDNFACFQRPFISNQNDNARVLLNGPLVVIPMDDKQHSDTSQDIIHYSVLVQIQDLNPLFNRNNSNNRSQPKGSIFIVLLQAIPSNYEVVLYVSNSYDHLRVDIKELNIGMNNLNPVVILPWPLPKIGRAVSFRIYAQLRPIQKDINSIQYGLEHMFSSKIEQKTQDNIININNVSTNAWSVSDNKIVMCIYNNNNKNNNNRLSWINVAIHDKMMFRDMIDSATAQLGLPSPNNNNNNTQRYVVRNQMGHPCPLDQLITKYLDAMMMNSNLFPVFIFTNIPDRLAFGNLNFNPSGAGDGTQSNPFMIKW